MSRFIIIEYVNRGDIPPMYFTAGYVEKLILDAGLMPTEEDVFEEGEEALHEFVPTFQRSIKRYSVETAPISNSTLEEIHRLPLYEDVSITLPSGEKTRMRSIEVEHEYPFPDARLAIARIAFDKGETLVKTACCNNMVKGTPPVITGRWSDFVCACKDGACSGMKRATVLTINVDDTEHVYHFTGVDSTDIEEMTDAQYITLSLGLIDTANQDLGTNVSEFIINAAYEMDAVTCPPSAPPKPVHKVNVMIYSNVPLEGRWSGLYGYWGLQVEKMGGSYNPVQGKYRRDLSFPSIGDLGIFEVDDGTKCKVDLQGVNYSNTYPAMSNIPLSAVYVIDDNDFKTRQWMIDNELMLDAGWVTGEITEEKYITFLVSTF